MNLPETGDEGEVQVEDILKPLDGGSGLVGEDLDQVGTGLVTGRLEGILIELLDGVANLVVNLGAGEGTVDTGGGLGRVTTEETCFAALLAHYAGGGAGHRRGDGRGYHSPCLSRTTTLPPAR